ncbi:PP2C family protein-serine/threonine phosphatase [Streptomyces indicus]|uniref:Serine phosphatase RsbU, regulator of sigma subunit n=1 Tax=Streptomyces indicus TaxID=417292 RepID=A0A1G9FCV0_9ACTN|nr:PP2C family protein-serine/threonine phosphatase [Streptomyces indicus]SDK86211.1 Serine phosphatase RsbU, regulator of sigma subunit [Streptomyces indicus]
MDTEVGGPMADQSQPGARAADAPGTDKRQQLALHAIEDLVAEQQRRIGEFTARAAAGTPEPGPPRRHTDHPPLPGPSVRELFDALPVAALLVAPVLDEQGEIEDFLYVGQNAEAWRYADEVVPDTTLPPWPGRPVPLFDRFPNMVRTAVPDLLIEAHRTGRPQGPAPVEWFLRGGDGTVVRLSNAVRADRCGTYLLLSWERGHRTELARAAQRLARACWAEWNLGDDTVLASLGARHVLGLPPDEPVPHLVELARMTDAEGQAGLYRVLYDVAFRRRVAECRLPLTSTGDRIIHFRAEPVQLQDGPVWGVRASMMDITREHLNRERAQAAQQEAQRQRERAQALADVAATLRDAVLPRFPAELAQYGLETAAVYRPDAGAGIGGDWFKARHLPNGRILIAVGDARGHGLEAVTLMAKLRYALAGLAFTGEPVEQLAAWLNTIAYDDGEESTTTAVIARYHRERSLLRWVCAGHPRPVLLRAGKAGQLPDPPGGPGLPLGVLPDASYRATEAYLSEGDVVLMYSDGLTERRDGDPDADVARLLEAAQEAAAHGIGPGHDGLQQYAEDVVQSLSGPWQTDDATLLVLRCVRPLPPGEAGSAAVRED